MQPWPGSQPERRSAFRAGTKLPLTRTPAVGRTPGTTSWAVPSSGKGSPRRLGGHGGTFSRRVCGSAEPHEFSPPAGPSRSPRPAATPRLLRPLRRVERVNIGVLDFIPSWVDRGSGETSTAPLGGFGENSSRSPASDRGRSERSPLLLSGSSFFSVAPERGSLARKGWFHAVFEVSGYAKKWPPKTTPSFGQAITRRAA